MTLFQTVLLGLIPTFLFFGLGEISGILKSILQELRQQKKEKSETKSSSMWK